VPPSPPLGGCGAASGVPVTAPVSWRQQWRQAAHKPWLGPLEHFGSKSRVFELIFGLHCSPAPLLPLLEGAPHNPCQISERCVLLCVPSHRLGEACLRRKGRGPERLLRRGGQRSRTYYATQSASWSRERRWVASRHSSWWQTCRKRSTGGLEGGRDLGAAACQCCRECFTRWYLLPWAALMVLDGKEGSGRPSSSKHQLGLA